MGKADIFGHAAEVGGFSMAELSLGSPAQRSGAMRHFGVVPARLPHGQFEQLSELGLVLREMVEAMRGIGAALTLHVEGHAPRIIYVDEDAGISRAGVEKLLASEGLGEHLVNGHAWLKHEHRGRAGDALALPVQRVPGHSMLLVTVFFGRVKAEQRAHALTAYAQRQAFAIRYFRLWQENRSVMRQLRASEAALDLIEFGTVLLAASGRMVFANASARALLDDGSYIRAADRHLHAVRLSDNVKLQSAISHVLHGASQSNNSGRSPLLAIRRSGKPPLILSVLPMGNSLDESGDVVAMVFVVDPALDVEAALKPVCKVFQLSNVETALAALLATGSTLAEASRVLRVKEATARSYLRQIFAKTSTNRQADLVRVLLSSLIRISRGAPFEVV
jgi:DNA-binding CsgD family transcriptional regulator